MRSIKPTFKPYTSLCTKQQDAVLKKNFTFFTNYLSPLIQEVYDKLRREWEEQFLQFGLEAIPYDVDSSSQVLLQDSATVMVDIYEVVHALSQMENSKLTKEGLSEEEIENICSAMEELDGYLGFIDALSEISAGQIRYTIRFIDQQFIVESDNEFVMTSFLYDDDMQDRLDCIEKAIPCLGEEAMNELLMHQRAIQLLFLFNTTNPTGHKKVDDMVEIIIKDYVKKINGIAPFLEKWLQKQKVVLEKNIEHMFSEDFIKDYLQNSVFMFDDSGTAHHINTI